MQAPRSATPAGYTTRIVASLALLAMLSACGLKGPLYMPPPAETEGTRSAQPASRNSGVQGPAAGDPHGGGLTRPSGLPGSGVSPSSPEPGMHDASPGAPR